MDYTYIILSMGWDGFPIAYKLKQEGCEVMVGQVQSKTELGLDDDETPEDKEARLKQYDGMLEKMPARDLVDSLVKIEDKDKYFIFCDQNNLFKYAEELLAAGFTKGLFPLEIDYEFEKDREAAMRFVNENYPGVQIIPYEEFDNVNDAISFLKKAEKVYVIQSKGDHVGTMVPRGDDIDAEREQMINQLVKNKKDYEEGGIILKEKLMQPIEITPQIVFVDGKPVFTDLDIETKNIGDGENNGNQVGCGSNLVVKTALDAEINSIAFPEAVHTMAMTRTGVFVWDISLYVMPDGMYFGEFCSNRFGYDSIMTEITMAESADAFFKALCEGRNPLKKDFGTAVRLFNLNRQKDREVAWKGDNVYMYEVYEKDEKVMSLGCCWDLGVATGAGNTIGDAVDDVYETVHDVSFKELYNKTRHDFLDCFPTSIIFRFTETNHRLYDATDFEYPNETLSYEKKMRDMSLSHTKQMEGFRGQLRSILDEDSN